MSGKGFVTKTQFKELVSQAEAMAREASAALRALKRRQDALEADYLALAKSVSGRLAFFFDKSKAVDGMTLRTRPDTWMVLKSLQQSCDKIAEEKAKP